MEVKKNSVLFLAKAAILIAGLLLIVASRSNTLVAGGNDSLDSIYRLAAWPQMLALALLAISLMHRSTCRGRLGWGSVAMVAFAMSVHSIRISGKDNSLRDMWGLWSVRSVLLSDSKENRPWTARENLFTLELNAEHQKARIFLGIWPWRLDARAISQHPLLNTPPSMEGGKL